MTKIQIEQPPGPLEAILRSIPEGDDVVFLKGEMPIARFVSVPLELPGRKFGSGKGSAIMSEDFDAPLDDFDPYLS